MVGAEVFPEDSLPVVLWAPDRAAYGRLARLITCGRRRAEKGECQLEWEDIAQHAEGLLAGIRVPLDWNARPLEHLQRYRELLGDRGYLLVELHRSQDDRRVIKQHRRWSRISGLPLVAAGDVYYHSPARLPLHDVLTCIRLGTTVDQAGPQLLPNRAATSEIVGRNPDDVCSGA